MKSLTPIILPSNPTANLHAATKQYVDSVAGGGGSGPTTITDVTYSELKAMHSTGAKRSILGFAKRYGTIFDSVFIDNPNPYNIGDSVTFTGTNNNGTFTITDIIGENITGFTGFVGLHFSSVSGWVSSGAQGVISNFVSGTLEIGQRYRITDFATTYVGDAGGAHTINWTGRNEPLIVTAMTTDYIGEEAESELHPNDVINYRIESVERYNGVSAYTKGKITYRQDPMFNIIAYDDFRNYYTRVFKEETTQMYWVAPNVNMPPGYSCTYTDSKMVPMFLHELLGTISIKNITIANQNNNTLPLVFGGTVQKVWTGAACDALIILGNTEQLVIGECSNTVVLTTFTNFTSNLGGTFYSLNTVDNCTNVVLDGSIIFMTAQPVNGLQIGLGYVPGTYAGGELVTEDCIGLRLGSPQKQRIQPNSKYELRDTIDDRAFIGINTGPLGASDSTCYYRGNYVAVLPVGTNTTFELGNFFKVKGITTDKIGMQITLDSRAYSRAIPAIVYNAQVTHYAATHADAVTLATVLPPDGFYIIMIGSDETNGNIQGIISANNGALLGPSQEYVPEQYRVSYSDDYDVIKFNMESDAYIDVSPWSMINRRLRIEAIQGVVGGTLYIYGTNIGDKGTGWKTPSPDTYTIFDAFALGQNGEAYSWVEFSTDPKTSTPVCFAGSSVGFKYDGALASLGGGGGSSLGLSVAMNMGLVRF
jgi:hypothetical protein